MCNLYSFAKGWAAIRDITRAMIDKTGNLPLFPGIFVGVRRSTSGGQSGRFDGRGSMKLRLRVGVLASAFLLVAPPAFSDAWRDIEAAYANGDNETTFRLAIELAKQGDVRAQGLVGFLYDFGKGVEEDNGQAVYWYTLSAEQGDAKAQANLCSDYLGRRTAYDLDQALRWCRSSADQGDPFGQFLLGVLYLHGRGVQQDLIVAYKWFLLSQARATNPKMRKNASEALALAEQHLISEQIGTAKYLAETWKPSTP